MGFSRTGSALAAAIVGASMTASCAPTAVQEQTVVCAQTDVTARCILQNADAVLATITDPFDWSTSAVELGIAKDSNGDRAGALALFQSALDMADMIEAPKRRVTAYGDIALGLSKLKRSASFMPLVEAVLAKAGAIENPDVKTDVVGKLATARAVHGDLGEARARALAMPTESDTQDAFRGRTQREIAGKFAKAGDFEGAISTIGDMTAAFTYYSAVARTDVAAIAVKSGREDLAGPLFADAAAIAALQDNGYFSGAILRDIGYGLVQIGEMERANDMFADALALTLTANSLQEQARSTSRLATRLADCGLAQRSGPILTEALGKARSVKSDVMRPYALYEIAGSAAFSGEFSLARRLIADLPETPFGSAASLKSAGMRDLAWGLARAGMPQDAIATANAIPSKREKVHALGRLVRLKNSPEMDALPRYL